MMEFRHNEVCMGTVFQYFGRSEIAVDDAIAASTKILHEADEIFSLYKPDSPLSLLASGKTSIGNLPEIVSFVWDESEKWNQLTDGWFNAMTLQNTFDPSGYVKAWATNQAALKLQEFGIRDFAINAGGDIYLSDDIASGLPQRIAVANSVSIANSSKPLLVLDLNNTKFRAVATSGIAERGNHIWNPKSNLTADEFRQVTVVAEDLITADVLATALFAAGSQVETLLAKFKNQIEVLIIDRGGKTTATSGFAKLVSPV